MADVKALCEAEHSLLCTFAHRFADYLRQRPDPLICFTSLGIQVEGWLKGELLTFLTREKNERRIVHFDREVKCGDGNKKVDVTISFSDHDRSWMELKHNLIGSQKGVSYNAEWYLKDKVNGILADVQKLAALNTATRYVLILATANPGLADWQSAVAAFNQKFEHDIASLTDPSDFPDSFFLGLLHVVA
ncbi:hypothetical protein ACFL5Q_04950 [Planctomycetota bacterium]